MTTTTTLSISDVLARLDDAGDNHLDVMTDRDTEGLVDWNATDATGRTDEYVLTDGSRIFWDEPRRAWAHGPGEATRYEAVRYAADGHAGEAGDGAVIATGMLAEVRAAVASRIGADLDALRWDGTDDDVEAYHESAVEGCGGYAIRRAP